MPRHTQPYTCQHTYAYTHSYVHTSHSPHAHACIYKHRPIYTQTHVCMIPSHSTHTHKALPGGLSGTDPDDTQPLNPKLCSSPGLSHSISLTRSLDTPFMSAGNGNGEVKTRSCKGALRKAATRAQAERTEIQQFPDSGGAVPGESRTFLKLSDGLRVSCFRFCFCSCRGSKVGRSLVAGGAVGHRLDIT